MLLECFSTTHCNEQYRKHFKGLNTVFFSYNINNVEQYFKNSNGDAIFFSGTALKIVHIKKMNTGRVRMHVLLSYKKIQRKKNIMLYSDTQRKKNWFEASENLNKFDFSI